MRVVASLGALLGFLVLGVSFLREPAPVDEAPTQTSGSNVPGSRLDTLGYLTVSAQPGVESGVVLNEQELAQQGLTLVTPCGWGPDLMSAPADMFWSRADLIDAEGKLLHQWSADVFPGGKHGWRISRLGPDGSLFALLADTAVLKLDWDSDVIWKSEKVFHHDIAVEPDGTVWALIEKPRTVIHTGVELRILDHGMAKLQSDGSVERVIWLSKVMDDNAAYAERLDRAVSVQGALKRSSRRRKAPDVLDVLHANSVEVLPSDFDDRWKAGDLLVSIRHLNTIAVVDRESGALRWSWGPGDLQYQHDPTIVDGASILVFDNGTMRGWSRLLEVDPRENRIAWEYRADVPEEFFSEGRGQVQPLSNGNILAVSSQQGRILELTREGRVVWEYRHGEVYDGRTIPIRAVRLEGAALVAARKKLAAGG